MTTLHAQASQKIDAVEAELRRIGQWQEEPLPASALDFHEAFGSDKLTYFQWLQFVLVPRVRELVASGDEFPQGSSVGAYAVRELDGHPDAGLLVRLLSEFDALFDGSDFAGIEDGPAADADEGSVAAREMAAMGATGPADDAVLAVRGFLIGIQVGNPAASRARLTRPQRDDDTFVPQQPFEIRDFQTGAPEPLHDCVVVRTKVQGVAPDGSPAAQELPVVVVQEDGEWRIDLNRTAAMAMTGSPGGNVGEILEAAMGAAAGAMAEVVGGAMQAVSSAFADGSAREFEEARANFAANTRPELEAEISSALGVPVVLEVDWNGCERSLSLPEQVTGCLRGDLRTALSSASNHARARLAEGLARMAVRFARRGTERGVLVEGDALVLTLDPSAPSLPDWPILARIFELLAEPELRVGVRGAWAAAGALEDTVRDRHGIPARVDVNWAGFTAAREVGANAWSLYLLAERGILPFAAALDSLLGEDPALRDSLRDRLSGIRFDTATESDAHVLAYEDAQCCFALYVAETFTGYWTEQDLRGNLADALRAT